MSEVNSDLRTSTLRLILVPALISLCVTLLRLTGELRHWSPKWFSTETGGTLPGSPFAWIVGITWLAIPFGAYFAFRLSHSGEKVPPFAWRAGWAVAGVILMYGISFLLSFIPLKFPAILVPIWLFAAIAAVLQYAGWPELFKTLLAYGIAARIPVMVIMFFAMRGNWGTHYDYVGMPPSFTMPPWPRYLWLAFFPQLIFWVAFTITAGSFAGTVATAARPKRRKAPASAGTE
jgi:hypothetical protein